MKCSDKEWQHCRVEKMGCEGCYYNESNTCDGSNTNVGSIDKAICELKNYLSKRKIKYTKLDRHDKAIETVLKALEDYREDYNYRCQLAIDRKKQLDNSINKDRIIKLKEFYINCYAENKIELISLSNLIKNINILLNEV